MNWTCSRKIKSESFRHKLWTLIPTFSSKKYWIRSATRKYELMNYIMYKNFRSLNVLMTWYQTFYYINTAIWKRKRYWEMQIIFFLDLNNIFCKDTYENQNAKSLIWFLSCTNYVISFGFLHNPPDILNLIMFKIMGNVLFI